MKIAVVGSGYVGLVVGTCFADSGNRITCVDVNADKIASLNRGEVPIFEPGLDELIKRNVEEGRLTFSTDIAGAIKASSVIFIAVGTPQDEDGSADLRYVIAVADATAERSATTASTCLPIDCSTRPTHTRAVCARAAFGSTAAASR